MNAEDIRLANELCQKKCQEGNSIGAQEIGLASLNASMRAETAAQLAELNEKLKIILNPPLMYDKVDIDPAEFHDLPNPRITVIEARATLRDQFAMAAMTGLLADPTSSGPEGCATAAYKYADAMLESRLVRNAKVDTAKQHAENPKSKTSGH
jgi:hypothetical protein